MVSLPCQRFLFGSPAHAGGRARDAQQAIPAVGGIDAMQPVHARLRRFAYAERARMSFVVRKSRETR
jgi:hypothetical protein